MISKDLMFECCHCNNHTGHLLLCEAESSNTVYSLANPGETDEIDCTYYLTRCKTCHGVSLYYDNELNENPGYINKAYLCYPPIVRPSEEIPVHIARTFNEALKIEKVSLDGFALLIRKSLELLCLEKKANGQNLKGKIDDLAKRAIIPSTLSQIAHTLRILGNAGAHASGYRLDMSEIMAMKDFMLAMLEYVYVAPAKLERLQESIKAKMNK